MVKPHGYNQRAVGMMLACRSTGCRRDFSAACAAQRLTNIIMWLVPTCTAMLRKPHGARITATFPHRVHRLKLELARILPSFHMKPPVPSKHLNSVSVEPAAVHSAKVLDKCLPSVLLFHHVFARESGPWISPK